MKRSPIIAPLVSCLLLSAAGARFAAGQDAPAVERLEMPGLTNLAHVERGIYRGGRPRLELGGIHSLRELGIKNVVDLQGGDLTRDARLPERSEIVRKKEPGETSKEIETEIFALQDAAIDAVNIPLDSLDPVTSEEAADLERVLGLLAASSPERPVYVHCEHGKDRTGLVIALYRMRYDGWSQERAAAEMAEMGHTGRLDELFTGNMDLKHVLPLFPNLAAPPSAPVSP